VLSRIDLFVSNFTRRHVTHMKCQGIVHTGTTPVIRPATPSMPVVETCSLNAL